MGVQTMVDDRQCFLHDWAQGICAIRSKRINLIGYCFAIHFFRYEQSLLKLVGAIGEETRQIGGETIVLILVTTVLRVAHSGAASARLSGGVDKYLVSRAPDKSLPD